MNKPLKYGLLGLGGLAALAIAGATVFALTFDPNRYKDDIERLVKEQTGRTLKLKGDLKLAFYPSLGADVAGVTLSERAPDQEFLSFDSAHASVKLLPLLRGEYIVDSVKLSGLKARIVKGKDGRYNFSDLLETVEKKEVPAKKAAEPSKGKPVIFDVASISIERSSIAYSDLASGQELALEEVKLKTGRIAQDAEGRLEFSTVAKRKAPALEVKLALDGKYRLTGGKLSADVTAKLDESTIKAKFSVTEPYEFDASIDRLNLERYLGPEKAPAKQAAAEKQQTVKEEDAPIDLSALKGINARGRVQVGALEARGLKLADVKAEIRAENGRVAVSPHSARLYEGTISGELVLDADRNQVSLKETLSGISIGPLLRDFAQRDQLEGRGNIALDITAAGASVNQMKKSLAGTAKVELRDGSIKGINLAEVLRRARSALGSRSAASGQTAADNSQKTDFTELSASFTIKNGVAHNEDLDAKAPLFRLGGAGDINIAASTLDYTAKASVVATTRGQGGAERDRLAGLTVPVKLSGPFDDLKYEVDYRAMAGDAAKSEIGGKIRQRVEERLGDRLKGLLGR